MTVLLTAVLIPYEYPSKESDDLAGFIASELLSKNLSGKPYLWSQPHPPQETPRLLNLDGKLAGSIGLVVLY